VYSQLFCFFFLLGCRIRETGGIISRHAIRPDAQKAMKTHRSSPKNFISSTAPVRQINSQSVADRFFFFLGWNFRINRPRNNNAHGPIAKNGHRYAGFFFKLMVCGRIRITTAHNNALDGELFPTRESAQNEYDFSTDIVA
jgi:hypothetical protein